MLSPRIKKSIAKEHGIHEKDTGSAPVQVGILTRQIKELTGHLKAHPKDHSSRRGLLKLVGKRRRLMKYLERRDPEAHARLIKKLEL